MSTPGVRRIMLSNGEIIRLKKWLCTAYEEYDFYRCFDILRRLQKYHALDHLCDFVFNGTDTSNIMFIAADVVDIERNYARFDMVKKVIANGCIRSCVYIFDKQWPSVDFRRKMLFYTLNAPECARYRKLHVENNDQVILRAIIGQHVREIVREYDTNGDTLISAAAYSSISHLYSLMGLEKPNTPKGDLGAVITKLLTCITPYNIKLVHKNTRARVFVMMLCNARMTPMLPNEMCKHIVSFMHAELFCD